jgi:hypothetical protein
MPKNPEKGLDIYGVTQDPEMFASQINQAGLIRSKENSDLHQPRIYGLFIQQLLRFLQSFIDNDDYS